MKLFGKYRSFSHWFSYNWWWLALAAAALFLFAYTTFLQPKPPEPDYRLTWVGKTDLTGEQADAVVSTLTALGRDVTGDGQVLVELSQYPVDFTLTSADQGFQDNYTYVMKLLAELQTNQCYLFLLEQPERFQFATGALQYLDGTVPSGEEGSGYESENWEQMCVPFEIEGSDRQAWLARRCIFGDGDRESLYPGAEALFQAAAGLS